VGATGINQPFLCFFLSLHPSVCYLVRFFAFVFLILAASAVSYSSLSVCQNVCCWQGTALTSLDPDSPSDHESSNVQPFTCIARKSSHKRNLSLTSLRVNMITVCHEVTQESRSKASRLMYFDIRWCSVVSLTLPSPLPQKKRAPVIFGYR
jgi:hypothetical protein